MLDNKFFFTLVGIMVAVFAMCNINFTKKKTENFWMTPMRKTKVIRTVKTPQGEFALQNNLQGHLGNNKFIKTPSFQGVISPRFMNVDVGANIRYNTPDYQNMASPCNPLTFGNMIQENYNTGTDNVKENFCGSGQCGTFNGCAPTCGKGGFDTENSAGNIPAKPNFTSGNYEDEIEKVWATGDGDPVDALPVGNMTTVNASGEVVQPVVYDRYIFANRHSRLRSQGDPIRGDIPIVPCNNGWFNVAVNPNIDLQEGAMNVMGGVNNTTAQETAQFIFSDSGNVQDTIGGANLAQDFRNPQSSFNIGNTNVANSFGMEGSSVGGQETVYATGFN